MLKTISHLRKISECGLDLFTCLETEFKSTSKRIRSSYGYKNTINKTLKISFIGWSMWCNFISLTEAQIFEIPLFNRVEARDNIPFADWPTDRICEWMTELELGAYTDAVRSWVKNGNQLLNATNSELEKVRIGSWFKGNIEIRWTFFPYRMIFTEKMLLVLSLV